MLVRSNTAPSDALSEILQSGLLIWMIFLSTLRKHYQLRFIVEIAWAGLAEMASLSTGEKFLPKKAVSI